MAAPAARGHPRRAVGDQQRRAQHGEHGDQGERAGAEDLVPDPGRRRSGTAGARRRCPRTGRRPPWSPRRRRAGSPPSRRSRPTRAGASARPGEPWPPARPPAPGRGPRWSSANAAAPTASQPAASRGGRAADVAGRRDEQERDHHAEQDRLALPQPGEEQVAGRPVGRAPSTSRNTSAARAPARRGRDPPAAQQPPQGEHRQGGRHRGTARYSTRPAGRRARARRRRPARRTTRPAASWTSGRRGRRRSCRAAGTCRARRPTARGSGSRGRRGSGAARTWTARRARAPRRGPAGPCRCRGAVPSAGRGGPGRRGRPGASPGSRANAAQQPASDATSHGTQTSTHGASSAIATAATGAATASTRTARRPGRRRGTVGRGGGSCGRVGTRAPGHEHDGGQRGGLEAQRPGRGEPQQQARVVDHGPGGEQRHHAIEDPVAPGGRDGAAPHQRPVAARSRSTLRRIFPVCVLGSSGTRWTVRGALYAASRSRAKAISSSCVAVRPSASET